MVKSVIISTLVAHSCRLHKLHRDNNCCGSARKKRRQLLKQNASAVLAIDHDCKSLHDVRTQRTKWAQRKTATSNLPRTTLSMHCSLSLSVFWVQHASRSRSIELYLCVQLFYATRGGRAIQRSAGGRTTRTVASTLPTSSRCGCHRYLYSPIRPFVWRWEGLTLMPSQTPSQNPRWRCRRPHNGSWSRRLGASSSV